MCFGGNEQDMGGESQVIYVPMDYASQIQPQQTYQAPQYLSYAALGSMNPQDMSQGQGQGASGMLNARPQGGDFSSAGNLGTTSMLPGASQLLRQASPQYTWA